MYCLSQLLVWPRDSFICCQNKKKDSCAIEGLTCNVLPHTFLHGLPNSANRCRRHGCPRNGEATGWKKSNKHMKEYSVSKFNTHPAMVFAIVHSDVLGNYGSHMVMQHNLGCSAGSGSSSSSHQVPRPSLVVGHLLGSARQKDRQWPPFREGSQHPAGTVHVRSSHP